MLDLKQGQSAMMQALDQGPDFLPDGLFAGSPSRIIAGMKVHANTISHARLVALEASFPKTLALIGGERFNQHSRHYLDHPGVVAQTIAHIGLDFARFLSAMGEAPPVVDLARFEWNWLQTYHAQDAVALTLADLAGIAPKDLVEVAVQVHPAACIDRYDLTVFSSLMPEVTDLPEADLILLTRPDTLVLISPATTLMQAMLPEKGHVTRIGNLLSQQSETESTDGDAAGESFSALIALIGAGALCATSG
jgi:hypothetical protein